MTVQPTPSLLLLFTTPCRPIRDARRMLCGSGGSGSGTEEKEEADENRPPLAASWQPPQHKRQRRRQGQGRGVLTGRGGTGRGVTTARKPSSKKSNKAAAAVDLAAANPPRTTSRALRVSAPTPSSAATEADDEAEEEDEDDSDVPGGEAAATAAERGGRAKRATSEDLAKLKVAAPGAYKRILGNRKSAAESKARKESALHDANQECARLRKENARLAAALDRAQKKARGGGSVEGGGARKAKSAKLGAPAR